MDTFQAIVVAVVEGVTEYLPVSSTAHMIFTSTLFGTEGDEFSKMYQVSIQLGAILAVVVLYWKKFFDFKNFSFYLKLAFAVLPAIILGKLFDDKIEAVLEKPLPIAITLVLGGIFLLFVDKIFDQNRAIIHDEKQVSIKKAVTIGFWQCLAMMPGTSRSAASIIGGMQQGLSRSAAAEFSFFLAVPTMLAVTVYSIFLKKWTQQGSEISGYEILLQGDNLFLFILGSLIAFVVAMVAIKLFVGMVKRYGFRLWGWYRIIVGLILVALFWDR